MRPYRVGLAVLLALGSGVLYYNLDPSRYPFPRCPFYLLTGLFCPGCGSQRATHALLHGRVAQAAGLNLLAVAALPLLAIGAVDGVRAGLTGVPRRATLLYRPWLGWLTVAFTLAFVVLRNLPGALGTWLAP